MATSLHFTVRRPKQVVQPPVARKLSSEYGGFWILIATAPFADSFRTMYTAEAECYTQQILSVHTHHVSLPNFP